MKIKLGEKLPQNDFFYLDKNNEVKKISTNDALIEAILNQY